MADPFGAKMHSQRIWVRIRFLYLKWHYDKKITSFFPSDFKRGFVSDLTGKILRFEFYPKAVFFSASVGFHGPPLFSVKIDRLDFRGLDRG